MGTALVSELFTMLFVVGSVFCLVFVFCCVLQVGFYGCSGIGGWWLAFGISFVWGLLIVLIC